MSYDYPTVEELLEQIADEELPDGMIIPPTDKMIVRRAKQSNVADDAQKWNGRKLHESSSKPSDADEGDLWIDTS